MELKSQSARTVPPLSSRASLRSWRLALLNQGVTPDRVVARGYGKEYPVQPRSSASGTY